MLCDDPAVQPVVPQVIIGNEHLVPEAVRIALEAESLLMSNVKVLRRKSAWVNDATAPSDLPTTTIHPIGTFVKPLPGATRGRAAHRTTPAS